MAGNELQYESFLNDVQPAYREFVNQMNDFLLQNVCKIKIELAKSGYVISYSIVKTKKVIANFVFRKGCLVIRIYGDNVNKYIDIFNGMPEGMIKSIDKATVCKRLIDPASCNSRCPMGYDFNINDTRYQKCRYGSFMFEINDEIKILSNFFTKNMLICKKY